MEYFYIVVLVLSVFMFSLFYFVNHSVWVPRSVLHVEDCLHRLPLHTAGTCVFNDKAQGGGWNLWDTFSKIRILHSDGLQCFLLICCTKVKIHSNDMENFTFPSLTGSTVYTERRVLLCRVKQIFFDTVRGDTVKSTKQINSVYSPAHQWYTNVHQRHMWNHETTNQQETGWGCSIKQCMHGHTEDNLTTF